MEIPRNILSALSLTISLRIALRYVAAAAMLISGIISADGSFIRINQAGYLPNHSKIAVFVSLSGEKIDGFELIDNYGKTIVYTKKNVAQKKPTGPFLTNYRLDFSGFRISGEYHIKAGTAVSPKFRIDNDVYKGFTDFLLKYMRQQRCGFNPDLYDSCHTADGYSIYGPMADGTYFDVRGGWHDAADYLQYVTTSANAVYNLFMTYRDYPDISSDIFNSDGLPQKNEYADILDEALWGLRWLEKMNPASEIMFTQIADDRDHAGFRLPNKDSVNYGFAAGRPVYFNSGEKQGLMKYQNRTEGTSSIAGKFSSAFAIASSVISKTDNKKAAALSQKSLDAWLFAQNKQGFTNTAPCKAPYFYEEENWHDDMELAASQLYRITGDEYFMHQAAEHAFSEKITPWMGADTARHYQWYPFINIGHYELHNYSPAELRETLASFYRAGIQKVVEKGRDNAFLMGIPFIWCSANLTASFMTQCLLYRKMTNDNQFAEVESAMFDWLLGCNPWGVSFIVGLPEGGTYPVSPHSSLTRIAGIMPNGGLVDGPVMGSIFRNLQYVSLTEPDEYAPFQSDWAVYHDDIGDYSTNEPTMDGTAILFYYFAYKENEGRKAAENTIVRGGLTRGNQHQKEISLVFTGDEFADGSEHILNVLKSREIKASFFLTGKFLENPEFRSSVERIVEEGHYLGPHSDQHLLYCDWSNRDSLLITKEMFLKDLTNNNEKINAFGIEPDKINWFLPPYEWYNDSISVWSRSAGLQLINFSPGTLSHADYTIPGIENRYYDSDTIWNSIIKYEAENSAGLNGFILLTHIGTHPSRSDKFYLRLEELIDVLQQKGYTFVTLDELFM